MPFDRNGLEILDRRECLDLLATRSVGRIGLSRDALPTILPVNYALVGEDIVYASGTGTKALAAIGREVVAFEVDDADITGESGWSVVVVGIPVEVGGREPRVAPIEEVHLEPWIGDLAPYRYLLSTDRMTGRRVTAPEVVTL